MATMERSEGPTPHGGVASEIYYFDGEHRPIDKQLATGAEVVELDVNGNQVYRTYARLQSSPGRTT